MPAMLDDTGDDTRQLCRTMGRDLQPGRRVGRQRPGAGCPRQVQVVAVRLVGGVAPIPLDDAKFRLSFRRKVRFAVLTAAAQHGGLDVDLLDDVAWWQTDDFWRHATYAALA